MKNRRAGFSLAEMLVVAVLGAATLAAAYRVLVVQERGYRYQAARVDAQRTARVALQVLAGEVREVSPEAGDLVSAASDSLTVRATRKLGIICNVNASSPWLDVWRFGTDGFAVDDTLHVFADGNTSSGNDDAWGIGVIGSVEALEWSDCDAVEWGDHEPQRLVLNALDDVSAADVERGGVVRSYRTFTYAVYPDDDNGGWALGRRGDDGSVVALLGGVAPRDEGGLEIRYYQEDGTEIDPTTATLRESVRRIEIRVGTRSRGRVTGDHEFYNDSLVTQVHLRNG
ncbi:MAG: PilW family protein [Gemmatimonadota bacterium]